MGQVAADVEQVEEDLYRQMMTSPGGVMLLVRLAADLSLRPAPELERLCGLGIAPNPSELLPKVARLRTTYEWLEKKFGGSNAKRAIVQTCQELLQASA